MSFWNKLVKSSSGGNGESSSQKDIERSSDDAECPGDQTIMCQAQGEGKCEITGCVVLNHNTIVVADQWNVSLKLVSTDASKPGVISSLKLGSSPFDLTLTPTDIIAVTVPYQEKIVFASIQKDVLSLTDAPNTPGKVKKDGINLDGKCFGIKYSGHKLYVVKQEESKNKYDILVLNLTDGSTSLAVPMQQFQDLRYLTIVQDKIYITSGDGILRFKKERKDVASDDDVLLERKDAIKVISRERFSHGIIEVHDGIIVCNMSKNSVHMVSRSVVRGFLSRRQELLSISKPMALCYCPDTYRMFVSQAREGGNKANMLTVYQMK